MKRFAKKYIIIPVVVVAVLAVILFITGNDTIETNEEKYAGVDLSAEIDGVGKTKTTYNKYLAEHEGAERPDTTVEVDVTAYTDGQAVSVLENYQGEAKVLRSDEDGFVEWNVNVETEGFYNIYMEYFQCEGRGIDIERCLYINGEMPFSGADALTFTRIWHDKSKVTQDNRGNDVRPSQVEAARWESTYMKDYMGYNVDPYVFYFQKGTNTIRMEAVNEPLVIRKMTLVNDTEEAPYQEYSADYSGIEAAMTQKDYIEIVQGEDASFRSSPSLYAFFDRSSSNTEPYSSSKIRLNAIGGDAWRVAGQWIEWEVEVPENGMYEISIKGRQNYERGFVSNRSLYIDGVIPFEEVGVIGFSYNNAWELTTLSDANGTPYKFYMEKGAHILRLEVTLGDFGAILQELETSVYRMNEMYRKILILTGTTPDKYRDYAIEGTYPEVIEGMELESKRLYELVDRVASYTGQKSEAISVAQTLAAQMEKFVKRPDKIPQTLANYKENISALGTSILSMSESRLDVDYIVVSAAEAELPKVSENFFDRAGHEIRSFFASFFEDYTSLGNVYDESEAIDVWMLSGRDQSNVLKTMIDDTFTPNFGVGVNVKLVDAATLLPSVVAGTGPDVALSVTSDKPVNFALRSAAVDLTQFEGYEEVFSEYRPSSYVQYEYNGGIYGIPETQIFNVMFYRTDILEELGIEPPTTWAEFIEVLPIIQHKNLTVGVPSTERKFGNVSSPDLSGFFAQLYQHGGRLYNDIGSRTLIDTESGVAGFEFVTMLFTHYKLPTEYDFLNRFRSGEMPLAIADYNNYNTLAVFAPEIRGLWDFTLIPGTVQEDGSVDHSVSAWGVCSMMLNGTDNKDDAWTFLKWWADDATQVRFGRELESVMGASARYATANSLAFEQLTWSKSQREVLSEQWDWVVGTPEVPGGYYTSWHIVNAIRKVINDLDDPRETLLDYARTINEELVKKRKEFGLSTEE